MTQIHLIAREVAQKALAAHATGSLGAQQSPATCQYRDAHGCGCAVGVSLTDEQVAALNHAGANGVKISLTSISADHIRKLISLQDAHDYWTCCSSPPSKADAEARFLEIAQEMAR
jgi:hypothetical protein